MTNLAVKKQEIKEFLNELDFTVSIDFELEPQGVLFADIHEVIYPVNNNMSVYQAFRTLEVTLQAIVTDTTQGSLYRAVELMSDEYFVHTNVLTDNELKVTMRGNFYE